MHHVLARQTLDKGWVVVSCYVLRLPVCRGPTTNTQLWELIRHFLVVEICCNEREVTPLERSKSSEEELIPYMVCCFTDFCCVIARYNVTILILNKPHCHVETKVGICLPLLLLHLIGISGIIVLRNFSPVLYSPDCNKGNICP